MSDEQSHGDRVKTSILKTGLKLWHTDPGHVTARRIGRVLNLTHSAVLYHFGSADAMRDAIAAHAVRVGDKHVVPQLITSKHAAVASLTEAERRHYLASC